MADLHLDRTKTIKHQNQDMVKKVVFDMHYPYIHIRPGSTD